MKLGLQLYTVRDTLAADFEGTLKRVAALGFQGVEFAGNYGEGGNTALKTLLDDLGLAVAGLHVGLDLLELDLETQIERATALGSAYLVCPWLHTDQYANGFEGIIERLRVVQARLQGTGLTLAYHNHVFEFEHRVENDYALDAIAAAGVALEFDMAWGFAGGVNPAAYLNRHAGHVPLLHVKDLRPNGSGAVGTDAWETVELGAGGVPVQETLETASGAGVQWALIEQDHCPGDPFHSLEQSLSWWRTHQA